MCALTAQTQYESQTRAFLWASRCFPLTLPYLIKRDGSGPWGQSGTHTHTHTHTKHTNTNAHTHKRACSLHAPPRHHRHAKTHGNANTPTHTHTHICGHTENRQTRGLSGLSLHADVLGEKVSRARQCESLNATKSKATGKAGGRPTRSTHSHGEQERMKGKRLERGYF